MNNQVNDLLLLTDPEIDYKSLAAEILEQLALESDPYIANSALTELWTRNGALATETAWQLLSRPPDEPFLQSTALRITFTTAREKALDYMMANVQDGHPQLLNTIVDLLLYESDFRDEMRIAAVVRQRIEGHAEDMGDDLDPNTFADFLRVISFAGTAKRVSKKAPMYT